MTKQQLAARIWESANKMRNKIEASEYKDYILGLIFYRFLSDEEVKWLKTELGCSDKDIKEALYKKELLDAITMQDFSGKAIAKIIDETLEELRN